MIKMVRTAALLAAMMSLLPAPARASGGSPMSPPGGTSSSMPSMESAPQKTPEQQAVEHYNAGIKMRDKALALQKEAEQTSDEKQRARLENKAQKEFGRAIAEFEEATKKNPSFYQASSDLGFVLRKTGQYEVALEYYARALSLAPNYTPAIEYRAEAYLALDRLDEAKEAYMQLFTGDRAKADELFKVMKAWVEKRHADPGKLSPGAVQDFANWVQEREGIAGQTPSVSELQERKW
jgi:tetratricopeptide (TPR) repeat protein